MGEVLVLPTTEATVIAQAERAIATFRALVLRRQSVLDGINVSLAALKVVDDAIAGLTPEISRIEDSLSRIRRARGE